MDPTAEEAADGSILVKVLAAVLERLVNSNKTTARSDPGQLTKFHALKPPGIGVEAYLDRYVVIDDIVGFHFGLLLFPVSNLVVSFCCIQSSQVCIMLERVLHISSHIC